MRGIRLGLGLKRERISVRGIGCGVLGGQSREGVGDGLDLAERACLRCHALGVIGERHEIEEHQVHRKEPATRCEFSGERSRQTHQTAQNRENMSRCMPCVGYRVQV